MYGTCLLKAIDLRIPKITSTTTSCGKRWFEKKKKDQVKKD